MDIASKNKRIQTKETAEFQSKLTNQSGIQYKPVVQCTLS